MASPPVESYASDLTEVAPEEEEEEEDDKLENNDDTDYQTTSLTEGEIATEVCQLAGNPTFCKIVKAALRMENRIENPKTSFSDLMSLPTRQYLDLTVVPILTNALTYLGRERPVNPIIALAAFLMKYRATYEANYEPGQLGPSASISHSKSSLASKSFQREPL